MILRRNRSGPPGLRTLFDAGTAVGLTDGQLLERFTTLQGASAEPAFAALVERHGPMVWRVCRAILDDAHDAEDAFQATFLILVRRAGSLWVRDSLGPWLHRVASRAAIRARVVAGRRRAAERDAGAMRAQSTASRIDEECAGVIHAEIDRLPDRYRLPVVLCDIEGRSYEDAARHLRCPVGTLKSRLARGRERLKVSLARRFLAGPAALAVAGVDRAAIPAAAPYAAVRSTIRVALEAAARGATTTGARTVAQSVTSLVREISMRMFWESTRSLAGLALAAIIAAVGAGLLASAAVGPGTPAPAAPRRSAPAQSPVKKLVGIVRGPDDQPIAGATVIGGDFNDQFNHRIGKTGSDGRFELTPGGATTKLEFVIAYKEGLAPASFLRIAMGKADLVDVEVQLKLTRPVPFVGLVKDRDGRPIAGARVLARDVQYPDDSGKPLVLNVIDKILSGTPLDTAFRTTTDEQGRFVFPNLPPNAGVNLVITAPGMGEYQTMNRKRLDGGFGHQGTAESPAEIVMAPAARVVGRVETRLVGVKVGGLKVGMQGSRDSGGIERAGRTDAEGRFTFDGLDEGTANIFLVDHPNDGPWTYRAAVDVVLKTGQTTEVTIDLIRGVQVEGQVVDAGSGRPVAEVGVGLYGPIRPRSGVAILGTTTDDDGRFRFRLPPGETFFYLTGPAPAKYGGFPKGDQTVTIPVDVREFTVPAIQIRPRGNPGG